MTGPFARAAPTSGVLLPQIDALRGVAILFVFVQHLGDTYRPLFAEAAARVLPTPLVPYATALVAHGHWGVDLFFVLSGFSLGLGYARAYARGRAAPPPRAFLTRRAARILPAFYVALCVTLLARPELLALPALPRALAVHALVLQGYVSVQAIVIIGASWSLSTEASFYLLMPWMAPRILAPRRRPWLACALVVLSAWALRAALHEAVVVEALPRAYLELSQRRWIVCRLDQFVLGMGTAAAFTELHAPSRGALREALARAAPWVFVTAAAALVALFRVEGERFGRPFGAWPYPLVSLATAALVLAASLLAPRAARLASPRALTGLGIVSYGFFLYHQLALDLVARHVPMAQGAPTPTTLACTVALALPAAVLAGVASYVLVERRFLAK